MTPSNPLKTPDRLLGKIALPAAGAVVYDRSPIKSLIQITATALSRLDAVTNNANIAAELTIAEQVQANILNAKHPQTKALKLATHYQPAERLGGDWFAFIEDHGRNSVYILIGDVTGHGVAQGVIAAAIRGATSILEWHIQHAPDVTSPEDINALLNHILAGFSDSSSMQMTSQSVRLDLNTGQLAVSNSAHTFPFLFRRTETGHKVSHLTSSDFSGTRRLARGYREFQLEQGDMLMFYTDGLIEAQDEDGRSFGRRLIRQLKHEPLASTPTCLKEMVKTELARHLNGASQLDDVCFVVLEYSPKAGTNQRAS